MARISTILCALGLLASSAVAQNLIKTAPPCGKSCETMKDAYMGCIPAGGAPASDMSTYVSCFCNSALVGALWSDDPSSVCSDTCSPSQQKGLSKWYQNYCNSGGNLGGGSVPHSSHAPTATTGPAGSATGSGVPSSTAPTGFHGDDKGSWWSEHSKWIAMVIVLIIVFSVIIGVGVYLKRRHQKKRDRANTLPSNAQWGPNNSQIHVGAAAGGGYSSEQSLEPKEKYPAYHVREKESGGAVGKLKKLVRR